MSSWKATETCSCGASITTEAYTTEQLRVTLAAWREGHQHTPPEPTPAGAWFAFGTDYTAYPVGLAATADDALALWGADYGEIVFWPFGMDWAEAQKA